MPKSANVIGLQPNPTKCHKKKLHKSYWSIPWTSTPPPRSRHLLQHAPLRLYVLHQANNLLWIMKHSRMRHCTVHSSSNVADDLVWVERMSGLLLHNKNLPVRRDRTRRGINCVVMNGCRRVHNKM